jgi:predicted RNase H-like HicB family nuclease
LWSAHKPQTGEPAPRSSLLAAIIGGYLPAVDLVIELEREEDGRWLAGVEALPGVLAYGATEEEAVSRVEALALHVIADRLEHGELDATPAAVTFRRAA